MAGGESIGMIDLDAVLADDLPVKLNGKTWKLPGDAPTELLLSIILLSEQAQEAIEKEDTDRMLEVRAEMSDRVEDLFALRQEVPEGFGAALVDAQIGELVAKLFAHYYPSGEGGGGRPTPEPEAETPQSSRSSGRSRPRSPRSRAKAPAKT